MEIEKIKSMANFKEKEEDKNYNRYISKELADDLRKVIYFEKEKVYLCYTTETLEEAIFKMKFKNASK